MIRIIMHEGNDQCLMGRKIERCCVYAWRRQGGRNMKIVILGSGVIGVTSAYYLAKAGHEVVVLDRQPGPGLETSFANAGEVSPGYASPWAAPGIPLKADRKSTRLNSST